MFVFGGRRCIGIGVLIGVALAASGCVVEEGGEATDATDNPGAIEALYEETDTEAGGASGGSGGGGGGASSGALAEDPSGLCANQSCHQI